VVITPHSRELSRTLDQVGVEAAPGDIAAAPEDWTRRAADRLGVTVLLKGAKTHVASPGADIGFVVPDGPAWLATAGTGDVLAGIIGAMVATNVHRVEDAPEALAQLTASAALLHHEAARIASRGAPIAALDVADAVPDAIRSVLRRRR
jgi:NAD(P)H-hydrate repair Nnr-like enzyme with NAD(P)H-hydrate dehydratase domain